MDKTIFELLQESLEEAISFTKGEIKADVSIYENGKLISRGIKYINEIDDYKD